MKTIWKWLVGVVTLIVATLFLFKKKKKVVKESPPKSTVTKVVVEQINDDLKVEVGKVKSALKADNSAEQLANLGNSRGRS